VRQSADVVAAGGIQQMSPLSAQGGDIMSNMTKRLQQLELVNKSLKSEVGQKAKQIAELEKENQVLKLASS
jgi:hypothetical protein